MSTHPSSSPALHAPPSVPLTVASATHRPTSLAPPSSRACWSAGVEAGEVDEVILGQVLSAGEGQNPARQAAMKAGVPQEATAWGMNQLCGSGLRAVALGTQQIATGDAKIIVAGGMESMSMAPHCAHLRGGVKMGDFKMVDTMIKDGLTDAFYGYHMGTTAENVAKKWQLTGEDQDVSALGSQNKAEAAQKAGRFADEIIPFIVKGRKGDVTVDHDEYIRHDATLESMTKLRPAFDKEGTVTAGNASGLNDGAAATLLMTEAEAGRRGIQPLARIVSWATAGVDPQIMAQARFLHRARRWKRPVGRLPMSNSSRPTRHSRHRPAPSTRISAGIRRSSTSTAAPLPSATRSGPPVPVSSTRCSLK